jgi:hypothetical protein
MELLRREAITLASFLKYFNFSLDERKIKIEDAIAELSLDDLSIEMENYYGRKYIENEFYFFSNEYIQTFLSTQLKIAIKVKGKKPKLFPCFCCGYNTLNKRGEYFICKVCYWEDDGNNNLYEYNDANKMTLFDAKKNFVKTGVISEKFQNSVDHDRMIQYEKSNG